MSQYTVYITPQALWEVKNLPGNMRQRIKRAIEALADEPHPPESKQLDIPDDIGVLAFRLRLDKWRILYTITEADSVIDVLAVRKRPPYDYGDLEQLLSSTE